MNNDQSQGKDDSGITKRKRTTKLEKEHLITVVNDDLALVKIHISTTHGTRVYILPPPMYIAPYSSIHVVYSQIDTTL